LDIKPVSLDIAGNVIYASGRLLYVHERVLVAQAFDLERLETTGPRVPITEQEVDPESRGDRIAFALGQFFPMVPGREQVRSPLALIGTDGLGLRLLTAADDRVGFPSWAPDGAGLPVGGHRATWTANHRSRHESGDPTDQRPEQRQLPRVVAEG
jgi:hypothetical protein